MTSTREKIEPFINHADYRESVRILADAIDALDAKVEKYYRNPLHLQEGPVLNSPGPQETATPEPDADYFDDGRAGDQDPTDFERKPEPEVTDDMVEALRSKHREIFGSWIYRDDARELCRAMNAARDKQ